MLKLALILTFLLFVCTSNATQCIGLALQGGSDKGAFHAGALSALVNFTANGTTEYDVISGVSIGAVTAVWMSQYAKGKEQAMVNELVTLWSAIKPSDVYKQWPGSFVQGFLSEPSLYNTEPGIDYLKFHLTNPSVRYVSVGATDIENADYKTFSNFDSELPVDQLVQAVLASMALPALFPYQVINGTAYMDGGAVMSVDVDSAINKCREITNGDDSSIIIDVVLLTAMDYKAQNCSNYIALQTITRTIELMAYHTAITGLAQAKDAYPDVKWRYLIQPSEALADSSHPLDFTHDDLVSLINQGYADGQKSVSKGEGAEFEEFFEKAREKRTRRASRKMKDQLMTQYLKDVEVLLEEIKAERKIFCDTRRYSPIE